jgi:Uma2 family endonuclease
MNFQSNLRMDKAAFLAWIEAKEERNELAGGRVVMMPRPTRSHALIKSNLALTVLRSRLDRLQWESLIAFGLDAGPDTFRYPDVVVDRAGGNNKNYAATAPVLLAEVLSRERRDRSR